MTKAKTPQWEPTGDTFITPCDEKDCPYGFHRYAIHINANGRGFLVTDMDGNEEYKASNSLSLVTSPDTMHAYCASVAETGDDYLGVFIVSESKPQTWTVTLANWLGSKERGLRIVSGRRTGRASAIPMLFPKSVLDYLEADTSRALFTSNVIHSFDELKRNKENGDFEILRGSNSLRMKIRFRLDVAVPKPQVKRAIMRAARRAVRKAA